MTGKYANRPELQIKNRDCTWERSSAKEIFITKDDRNHPELPVLAASQELGMVKRESINYKISYDKRNTVTYKRVMPGQFVIHLRSFQGGFAHSCVEGITSPAYTVMDFRDKSYHDDFFWKYVLSSDKFINQLSTVTYGIRDGKSISFSDFSEMNFAYPSKEVQKILGEFLSEVDKVILIQKRKLIGVECFRKAMLTKLFPREGAAEPELRFRGFSGKWEQCTAKKIFESKDDRNHPDLPVLTATQEYGMVRRDRINYNVGHDKRNEVGYKRVLPGQFVIHLRSFQGGFAHSPLEGITSPAYTVIAFRDERKQDEYFWKYVFLSESFIKRLSTVTYGIRDGRSISFEDFGGLQLCFPSKEEQAKIGAVLRKIDSFISLQQKKLERMQRLKAALLEKLFV